MKKTAFMIFVLVFTSFCFLNAEENNDDLQSLQEINLESQLLQALGEEENDSSFLDALEDSNDLITDENESIIQEKERIEQEKEAEKIAKQDERKKKRENKGLSEYFGLGANILLNPYVDVENTEFDANQMPMGISLHWLGNYGFVTGKASLNWDFVKYTDKNVSFVGCFSLGITPIHNDYCFIGFYGTVGAEEIEKYSYASYGGSVNLLFNFPNRFGIFLNLDATCRTSGTYKGDEEIPPYLPAYTGTWRVCPSIGITYTFLRG